MAMYSWLVMSTTKIGEYYCIKLDLEAGSVECNCKSGRIRGYCKHIKFYKDLIKDLMHKNHRLWRDKYKS